MADRFFTQTHCNRCGGSLSGGRTMSMFDTSCICMKCAKNDNYNDGIESFVKTPSWETYFPDIHLQLLGDYQGFLNKIDEDYENAVKCRELFNQTIELIAKNEEEYLKLADELTSRGESHGRVQEG